MSRQDDIRNLIIAHNRRLQILKEQLASQGISVDPKVIIEIEDITVEIEKLQIELEDLGEKGLREVINSVKHYVAPNIAPPKLGIVPPFPALIVGREDDLHHLKSRLGIATGGGPPTPVQALTIIRGLPGVGKTTLVTTLAYDPDIANTFPDGVLWAALGEKPNPLSILATWGRALGVNNLTQTQTLQQIVDQLRGLLRDKQMLLIVDDVWETEHAVPFLIGGSECATFITTRETKIAHALAPAPNGIYPLPVLSDEKALELLGTLAPGVVKQYPQESLELVHDLEGLPLALQVAGRLLNAEADFGWGVIDLLVELHEGTNLLKAEAPVDRIDLVNQTTPTIAVLLQKSTDRLDRETRDYFAYLGTFAPKPATFDVDAIAFLWQVSDPKPIVRVLVDRGLLEPISGRFRMHALLVMHARSLFTE